MTESERYIKWLFDGHSDGEDTSCLCLWEKVAAKLTDEGKITVRIAPERSGGAGRQCKDKRSK